MESFYLDEFLIGKNCEEKQVKVSFEKLCGSIREEFIREWENDRGDMHAALQLQKRAIIGYENEAAYFKEKIRDLIKKYGAGKTQYPPWYENLTDAVYHENWGLAGVAEWFTERYTDGSSVKIIGERIYFMDQGRMRLMRQTISKDRREQLIRAFLLLTPEERLDKEFHEIYLLDGTRITIFGGAMTKHEQDVIIFRRYIVPNYTFEEQAARGTIPEESIPLFCAMVECGFNVVFCGQVRSAKSTFLSTWQSYEDPELEGVMIETDPEIPLHKLMPEAPIVQLIADNEKLMRISKNVLRSDADYVIMAEARDGNALDTAVRVASKGTRRMKITFHCREPLDFPYDAAWEIAKATGSDIETTARRVASAFDFVFHFVQLKNKNQKRLNSIYELSVDRASGKIAMKQICAYDFQSDSWRWSSCISRSKRNAGGEECYYGFLRFEEQLNMLAKTYPMEKQ